MFTQDRVRFLFDYDAARGVLIKKNKCNKKDTRPLIGSDIGAHPDSVGYGNCTVDGQSCKAHRVIWLWFYGDIPQEEIDHIDGNKLNNRIENLRAVSKQENLKNKKKYTSNKSGICGVHWCNTWKKWLSIISLGRKKMVLCQTRDFFEACCARKSAELQLDFHPNHGLER
jgi:hypothetical protein